MKTETEYLKQSFDIVVTENLEKKRESLINQETCSWMWRGFRKKMTLKDNK